MTTAPVTFQLRRSPITIGVLATSCIVSAALAPALVWVGDLAPANPFPAVLTYLLVTLVGGFLGALAVWDSMTRRIPNRSLIGLAVALVPVVIALTVATGGWGTLAFSASIALVWFVITLGYAMYKPEALGGGDLKVMPLIMLPLGLLAFWVPIVWAVASIVIASAHSLKRRVQGDGTVPFAPSMNVALPVALGAYALVQGSAGIIPG